MPALAARGVLRGRAHGAHAGLLQSRPACRGRRGPPYAAAALAEPRLVLARNLGPSEDGNASSAHEGVARAAEDLTVVRRLLELGVPTTCADANPVLLLLGTPPNLGSCSISRWPTVFPIHYHYWMTNRMLELDARCQRERARGGAGVVNKYGPPSEPLRVGAGGGAAEVCAECAEPKPAAPRLVGARWLWVGLACKEESPSRVTHGERATLWL